MSWLDRLAGSAGKSERVVAGLMSGTSADSIDVAVCRIGGDPERVTLIRYDEHLHDPTVREKLLAPGRLNVRDVAELHVQVAERFSQALLATLSAAGLAPADVDLVGSHGQTVYHHSSTPGALRATLQIGDGDVIAERTGLPVVSDFRARDVAAGGEGAPLSPRADHVFFPPEVEGGGGRRAVLNLGGIGNVTVLDPDPAKVFGFDTGPANTLIDRLARRISSGTLAYDRDGAIARSGRVNADLVEALLTEDEFLLRPPPKSTGFEAYGDAFVDHAAERHGAADADLMATLTEFTARSVALALKRFVRTEPPVTELVVAGGGWKNPALIGRITELIRPIRVRPSDELGVPSDAREAMAFAVLADLTLRGRTGSIAAVTGANRAAVLGKLSVPTTA